MNKYGNGPHNVVVIHGGPGAGGEMAPVAVKLSSHFGVLEPFQTELDVDGQVRELRDILIREAQLPVTLIGYSWGAWLSVILAANYPEIVKKLVLIGSGPFEEKYASGITETRMGRLSDKEKLEIKALLKKLEYPVGDDDFNRNFRKFGEIFSGADSFDPVINIGDEYFTEFRPDIFQSVWKEAAEMRKTGKLLDCVRKIKCPVTAIHGDYDPHPAEGVERYLKNLPGGFSFHILEKCGHKPWIEKHAVDKFYEILLNEIS